MKNILVIAHHHGAFITLESVFQDKSVDKVVVMVPESQLKKYAGFADDCFKNYEASLKAYVRKKSKTAELYVIDDSTPVRNAFDRPLRLLEELCETGTWLVMMAGSVYNPYGSWANISSKIGATSNRAFSGPQDMYSMIGLQPDNSMYSELFYLNMDSPNDALQRIPSRSFGRIDKLIGPALSAVECLKWSATCESAPAACFWMKAISRKLEPDEVVAYPVDNMLPYAKRVKKFLPEAAYNMIVENAKESSWYSDLRSTYL